MSQYSKNWTKRSVEKYVTQEAQQKSREEFEATHVPINRIKVERAQINAWAEKGGYITESNFYDAVVDSHLEADNRMFFVVGESGSGKSELCQWLEYNIQDKYEETSDGDFRHEPILIPRQVREPREVLQRLTNYLENDELDEARRLADLPPEGVLDKTTGEITLAFDKTNTSTIELLQSDEFKAEVRQNLNEFVNAFDDPSQELEFEPISEEKLQKLATKYPGVKNEVSTKVESAIDVLYEKITDQAKDSIKDMLFVGDLKDTLRQLNERFKEANRRPVLIIEDLTGFTIFQHEILSFFSDLQASNWDIVIGVTTGMNQKLVKGRRADITSEETINDRIEARVALTEQTDEGSQTLFLQQENIHIDLARKYLTAIKEDSNTEFTPELPISELQLDEAFGEKLYPFNEDFLTRIYENLQEDDQKKQTPRVYLKFVIEGLLMNESPPFEHADLLGKLGTIDNTISTDYHEQDRALLKWYGHHSKDGSKYVVDEQIPQAFNIESDGWAPLVNNTLYCGECSTEMEETNEGTPYCPTCETICSDCQVPMDRKGEFWICPNESAHKKPVGGRAQLFKTRRQELLDWRAEGANYRKTSKLEDGAERAIRYFHDNPTSLLTPPRNSNSAASVWWDKGSRMVPIHVTNGDEPDYRKIIISQNLPEDLLIDLLRIGIYDDKSIDDLIESGVVNPQKLRWWTDEAVADLRSQVEEDIEAGFGVTLDEVALFGKYVLNVMSGRGTEFTPEALSQPFEEDEPKASKMACPTDLNIDKHKIDSHRETLKGLFRARFHIRSNIVNYPKLKKHISRTSPKQLVNRMDEITKGDGGVKLGPNKSNGENLSDFLRRANSLDIRNIARKARRFQEESKSQDLDRAKSNLLSDHQGVAKEFQEGMTLSDINFDIIEKSYKQSNKSRPKVIDNVRQIDENTFESTVTNLQSQINALKDVSNAWELIGVYRELRLLTNKRPTKQVYENLSTFVTEMIELEDSLRKEKTRLEEMDFGDDLPKTESFDSAKEAASSLNDTISSGL